EVATRWPDVARRLVLVAPFGVRLGSAPPGPLFELQPPRLRHTLFADSDSEVALPLAPDPSPTMEAFEVRLTGDRAAARFAWRPSLHNPKLIRRLPRVGCPTLVLWGREDRLMAASYADAWAAALPDPTVKLIDHAGHALGFERPDEVGESIER